VHFASRNRTIVTNNANSSNFIARSLRSGLFVTFHHFKDKTWTRKKTYQANSTKLTLAMICVSVHVTNCIFFYLLRVNVNAKRVVFVVKRRFKMKQYAVLKRGVGFTLIGSKCVSPLHTNLLPRLMKIIMWSFSSWRY